MATKAKLSAGTLLKIGDGASPEVFTAVAEVLTLKKSGHSIKTADVTNMDSPKDALGVIYEEIIGTIATGGDVDVTYNFIPDTTGGQYKFRQAFDGQKHNFQIVTPIPNPATSPVTNWTFSFAGIVTTSDDLDFAIEKQIIGSAKVHITGPATLG